MSWVWTGDTLVNGQNIASMAVSDGGTGVWQVKVKLVGSTVDYTVTGTFASKSEAKAAAAEIASGTYGQS